MILYRTAKMKPRDRVPWDQRSQLPFDVSALSMNRTNDFFTLTRKDRLLGILVSIPRPSAPNSSPKRRHSKWKRIWETISLLIIYLFIHSWITVNNNNEDSDAWEKKHWLEIQCNWCDIPIIRLNIRILTKKKNLGKNLASWFDWIQFYKLN